MRFLTRWLRPMPEPPPSIEPAALAARLAGEAPPLVVDVRGRDEFVGPLGHIAGAANLPLDELAARLSDLARDRRAIVTVCRTDRRSATAAGRLRAAGAAEVAVLKGGMEEWRRLGLPVA